MYVSTLVLVMHQHLTFEPRLTSNINRQQQHNLQVLVHLHCTYYLHLAFITGTAPRPTYMDTGSGTFNASEVTSQPVTVDVFHIYILSFVYGAVVVSLY